MKPTPEIIAAAIALPEDVRRRLDEHDGPGWAILPDGRVVPVGSPGHEPERVAYLPANPFTVAEVARALAGADAIEATVRRLAYPGEECTIRLAWFDAMFRPWTHACGPDALAAVVEMLARVAGTRLAP